MRVTVNLDLCVGNGVCEAVAPDVFVVGADGAAELLVDEIASDQRQLVTEAVQSCPARALGLTI
ncbi:ferredoxin [Mycolicibacterium sp. XJ870]